MRVSKPTTALDHAINVYRACPYVPGVPGRVPLTQDDERVLDRLQASKPAQKAFSAWGLSDAKSPFFIGDCVKAHRYANGDNPVAHDIEHQSIGRGRWVPRRQAGSAGSRATDEPRYTSGHGHFH